MGGEVCDCMCVQVGECMCVYVQTIGWGLLFKALQYFPLQYKHWLVGLGNDLVDKI